MVRSNEKDGQRIAEKLRNLSSIEAETFESTEPCDRIRKRQPDKNMKYEYAGNRRQAADMQE